MFCAKLITLFLTLIPIIPTSCQHTPDENLRIQQDCGKARAPHPVKRSFGGIDLRSGEAPWAVAIDKSGASYCSGTLISEKVVLTAAHCVLMKNGSDFLTARFLKIRAGGRCLSFDECEDLDFYRGIKVIFPSLYLNNKFYDVALIELDRPTNDASFLCLSNENSTLTGTLSGAGYGKDDSRLMNTNAPMQEFKMNLALENGKELILAGLNSTQAVDTGDSGSGFYQNRVDGRLEVVGVMSKTGYTYSTVQKGFTRGIAHVSNVKGYAHWICKNSGICPGVEPFSPELANSSLNTTCVYLPDYTSYKLQC